MDETAVAPDAEALLGEMIDLHGEGLRRALQALDAETVSRLAEDPVVAQMLLVHGLHPVPLEERVAAALDSVRPYLESHGGDVALLGLEDGVAQLLLKGSCNGCASSASTLELAIEGALEEYAPDLLGVEVEGAVDKVRSPSGRSLPLAPAWTALDVSPAPGQTVSAGPLLVANVSGTLLAYRDSCAGCGAAMAGGALDDGTLTCAACGREWSLPLAGRALGPEDLQLEPVPLLEDGGGVRVAVPA